MTTLPLEGVKVLDLGQIYAAPYATFLMAMAGAEVTKVEPLSGDNLRGRGRTPGAAAPFAMLNSNKRSVALNLKDARAVELVKKMAAESDVLVENFRPGVLERLGLGPKALQEVNPSLIFASSSGYGQSGPYRDLLAMDLTIQAMSGIMSVTGFPENPPVKTGPAIGDFFGGVHLYAAVVTALYDRDRHGTAKRVDVAMLDAVYPSLMSSLGLYFGREPGDTDIPGRTGNAHSGMAESPYNIYPTSDGYIALICVTDEHWRRLVGAMGRPELADDGRYRTRFDRVQRMAEVDELVGDWTGTQVRDELIEVLSRVNVPSAPVRDLDEVVHDAHLHERGMLHDINHPEFGEITVPHSPLRVGDDQAELRPSPRVGEHRSEVFSEWLGVPEDEIKRLVDEGVMG